jgi:hypothetical protein
MSSSSNSTIKDVTPLTLGLGFVNELQPVFYRFPTETEADPIHSGFIPVDVRAILQKENISNFYGVSSTNLRLLEFVAPLVRAVQELAGSFKALQASVTDAAETMSTSVTNLTAQVVALQNDDATKAQLEALAAQVTTLQNSTAPIDVVQKLSDLTSVVNGLVSKVDVLDSKI